MNAAVLGRLRAHSTAPADDPARRDLARRLSLWLVCAIGAAAAIAFAWNWSSSSFRPIVRSDPEGYYAYLPAVVVDGDPSLRTLAARHWGNDPTLLADDGLRRDPATGEVVDKYGAGVAVAEAPLFLAGHAAAELSGERADGYGDVEQRTAAFSGVLAGLLGLLALRVLLLRRAPPMVALATLACVCLGTSLFEYMGYDSGFSHAYSFAFITLTVLAAERWRERPSSLWRALATGACAGMVVLIRPTNAVTLAPLVLLGVDGTASLRGRMSSALRHRGRIAAAAGASFVVFLPQLLFWHAETGSWLISPYPSDETFSPLHPAVGALLSWDPHGLLPYAPVLLLVIPGLAFLWRLDRGWFWPVTLGLAAHTYVIATWHSWWYGAGFGQRGFVDVVPYFAVALAALLAALRSRASRLAVGALAGALTLTTVLGMLAYWRGRIPLEGVSPAGYVRAILG